MNNRKIGATVKNQRAFRARIREIEEAVAEAEEDRDDPWLALFAGGIIGASVIVAISCILAVIL